MSLRTLLILAVAVVIVIGVVMVKTNSSPPPEMKTTVHPDGQVTVEVAEPSTDPNEGESVTNTASSGFAGRTWKDGSNTMVFHTNGTIDVTDLFSSDQWTWRFLSASQAELKDRKGVMTTATMNEDGKSFKLGSGRRFRTFTAQ